MTPAKDIDVAIDACRGADGVVDARAFAAALATPARATEAPSRSLAEIGRDAQKAALLAALEACAWNMSEVARRIGGNSANTLRAVRTLLPEEYATAKADGRIRVGGYRNRVAVSLTETTGRGKVGA